MKPLSILALAVIYTGCVPAAAIGTIEWWNQQHAHDKPGKPSSSCSCPDCSAEWSTDTGGTVPEHQPDFDGRHGRNCRGSGKSCK